MAQLLQIPTYIVLLCMHACSCKNVARPRTVMIAYYIMLYRYMYESMIHISFGRPQRIRHGTVKFQNHIPTQQLQTVYNALSSLYSIKRAYDAAALRRFDNIRLFPTRYRNNNDNILRYSIYVYIRCFSEMFNRQGIVNSRRAEQSSSDQLPVCHSRCRQLTHQLRTVYICNNNSMIQAWTLY